MISPLRKPLVWIGLFALLALVAEGGARAAESVLGSDTHPIPEYRANLAAGISALLADSTGNVVVDADLGWRPRPSYADSLRTHDVRGIRRPESLGNGGEPSQPRSVRADSAAADGTRGALRVAAFGDSYVYQPEVSYAETWLAVLGQALGATETLNFGVGNYGSDQALLRYSLEGVAQGADLVLIGVSPSQLPRAVSVFVPFRSPGERPLSKPRFAADDERRLELLPNPLRTRADFEALRSDPSRLAQLGSRDAWYSPWRFEHPWLDHLASYRVARWVAEKIYRRVLWAERPYDGSGMARPESEAFIVHRAVIEAFGDSVRSRGARAVVVFLPERDDVNRIRAGSPPSYATLRDALVAAASVDVLDAGEAFAAAGDGAADPFAPFGHYSAAGNALVGEWLAERLATAK